VIVNLSAGDVLSAKTSRSGYADTWYRNATLKRFLAFHVIAIPLCCWAWLQRTCGVHEVGSNKFPTASKSRKQPKDPQTGLPLEAICRIRTFNQGRASVVVFLMVFTVSCFSCRRWAELLEYKQLSSRADPLKTRRTSRQYGISRVLFDPASDHAAVQCKSFLPSVVANGVSTTITVDAMRGWTRSPVKSIVTKVPCSKTRDVFVIVFCVGYSAQNHQYEGQFGAWLGNADRATVVALQSAHATFPVPSS